MGTYLKQSEIEARKKKRAQKSQVATTDGKALEVALTGPNTPTGCRSDKSAIQHDINYVYGLAGIEESLDWLARGIEKLTSNAHSINLDAATGAEPFKITLAPNDNDNEMDRVLTALERLADSFARLAGLNRPRLESWHEQDEYEPRYKGVASDGGAPGPRGPQPTGTEERGRREPSVTSEA